MKPQAAVLKETKHIAIGTALLCAIMLGVFLVLGKFDLTVLWGALAGSIFAIGNFFALAMTVQKATANPKRAKATLQTSYSARMLAMIVYIIIGVKLPFINWIALAIPLVFPRITIALMQLTGMVKKSDKTDTEQGALSIETLEKESGEKQSSEKTSGEGVDSNS